MKSFLPSGILIAALVAGCFCSAGYAADGNGSAGDLGGFDRTQHLLESQDEYQDSVQRLRDADADVVRAREAAIKDLQSAPEFAAAVKAVHDTYQAYSDRKNSVIAELEKKDPRYPGMKSQAAAVDAQIETASQNAATTQAQLEQLQKDRDTFLHQVQQMESDAIDRAQLGPQRQAWLDASKKLADMQDKQRAQVESNDKVKSAIADLDEARMAVEQARASISGANVPPDIAGTEEAQADDFLRRYNRAGFAGNDAWWTYGWTTISNGKTPATK